MAKAGYESRELEALDKVNELINKGYSEETVEELINLTQEKITTNTIEYENEPTLVDVNPAEIITSSGLPNQVMQPNYQPKEKVDEVEVIKYPEILALILKRMELSEEKITKEHDLYKFMALCLENCPKWTDTDKKSDSKKVYQGFKLAYLNQDYDLAINLMTRWGEHVFKNARPNTLDIKVFKRFAEIDFPDNPQALSCKMQFLSNYTLHLTKNLNLNTDSHLTCFSEALKTYSKWVKSYNQAIQKYPELKAELDKQQAAMIQSFNTCLIKKYNDPKSLLRYLEKDISEDIGNLLDPLKTAADMVDKAQNKAQKKKDNELYEGVETVLQRLCTDVARLKDRTGLKTALEKFHILGANGEKITNVSELKTCLETIRKDERFDVDTRMDMMLHKLLLVHNAVVETKTSHFFHNTLKIYRGSDTVSDLHKILNKFQTGLQEVHTNKNKDYNSNNNAIKIAKSKYDNTSKKDPLDKKSHQGKRLDINKDSSSAFLLLRNKLQKIHETRKAEEKGQSKAPTIK